MKVDDVVTEMFNLRGPATEETVHTWAELLAGRGVAPGATVHGYIRLRGEPVSRLFRVLRCSGSQAEQGGIVWWFDGGLRLYLPDRPALPELPFELTVLGDRSGSAS